MQAKYLLLALFALLALAACLPVEGRSVAQLKAAVLAETQAKATTHAHAERLSDAPVGAQVKDLQKYSRARVIRVHPEGIGKQLPGDRENNEDAIQQTKFDLRWAKSIKQKHLNQGAALVPTTDRLNSKFLDFQAKNTRLPLIAPHLFND